MDDMEWKQTRVVVEPDNVEAITVRKDIVVQTAVSPPLSFDLYYPPNHVAGDPKAAVLFIHGQAPPEILFDAKEWGQYVSWGQLAASVGLIGITFTYRSSEWFSKLDDVLADVEAAFTAVSANAEAWEIDPNRLGVWCCSGGAPTALRLALFERRQHVRCVASYYGRTDLTLLADITKDEANSMPPVTTPRETLKAFSPLRLLRQESNPASLPPLLMARGGADDFPGVNASIDAFVAEAIRKNIRFELHNHPTGEHGFDIYNDDPHSRHIIRQTLNFFLTYLKHRKSFVLCLRERLGLDR